MKVYLDTCSLQRPRDDQSQIRIRLEAQAVLAVVALIETGALELVSSDALLLETRRVFDLERSEFAAAILAKASHFVAFDDGQELRSQELMTGGVKAMDALHLAAAEAGAVDYFCSCDDKLLKKAKTLCLSQLRPVTPTELLKEVA